MATAMVDDPRASLPYQHDGSWGDLKAAYRLLSNPGVDPQAIQRPHRLLTWRACEAVRVVLVVQDDTELDFSRRASRGSVSGMGPLGGGAGVGRGMYQHTAMAVDPSSRRVLGLLDQRWLVRDDEQRQETRRQRQSRTTEADRWEQVARRLAEQDGREETRLIHVGDRHSDVWRFMQCCGELGHGFIVRAFHDRYVNGRGQRLWSRLAQEPPQASLSLQLTRQRNRMGTVNRVPRPARVTLRWTRVSLPPPTGDPRTRGDEPLQLTAIYVREDDPPEGVKPDQRIDWMLLTSEPVRSTEDALRIVGYYQQRWLIEEFHRCLKEGCRIEASRLDHAHDIQRLAAIQSVLAVRMLQTRDAARDPMTADDPATLQEMVPPEHRRVVALWTGRDVDTLTPKQFYLAVAKRGGYLGRKRDGPPGWLTLHRGMRDLLVAADTLARAGPDTCG